MVGRLVEQQHVGLGEQQLRQLDAHAPAAREARERPLAALGVEAEALRARARRARRARSRRAARSARAARRSARRARRAPRLPTVRDLGLDARGARAPARRGARGRWRPPARALRARAGSISWRSSATRRSRGGRTRPSSGGSSPAAMRSSVVLPAPFGPTSADAVARAHLEVDALEEAATAKALADVVEAQQHGAESRGAAGAFKRPLGAFKRGPRPADERARGHRATARGRRAGHPPALRHADHRRGLRPGRARSSRPWCAADAERRRARHPRAPRAADLQRGPRLRGGAAARPPYVLVLLYFELLDGRLRRRRVLH